LLTKISCESLDIELINGRIENEDGLTKSTAFIMPIDTAFSNECISHTKSVAYSILAKFHFDKMAILESDITNCLKNKEKINGKYFQGTTIVLPDKYNTPAKCIFSASAAFGEIYATAPQYINACISNIFKISAENRLDKLVMPILGSGRAGMELNEALRTLVSSIKFYSRFSPTIKLIRIYTIDSKKIKDINLLKKIIKI
jgi:O-acetyl-ADP-ribose deacetylase (regulator of RNase III)